MDPKQNTMAAGRRRRLPGAAEEAAGWCALLRRAGGAVGDSRAEEGIACARQSVKGRVGAGRVDKPRCHKTCWFQWARVHGRAMETKEQHSVRVRTRTLGGRRPCGHVLVTLFSQSLIPNELEHLQDTGSFGTASPLRHTSTRARKSHSMTP